MYTTNRPVAIDLFAGAGGMSLGFEQAGFDVVAALEYDPIHCATHAFNFPLGNTICADASKISGKDLMRRTDLAPGQVDLVFGGPPCQGFSLMGKRLADDPRNALVFHFCRLVEEISPRFVVMENVAGLSVGEARTVLDGIVETLTGIGYEVRTPIQILNATHYGVPQDRRRLFVMACREGDRLPAYPPLTHVLPGEKSLLDFAVCPTVHEAIGDLPDIDTFDELLENDSAPYIPGPASLYAKRLRGDVEDETDFSYCRQHDRYMLTSSMRTDHTSISRSRFADTPEGETEPVSHFLKLSLDGICNTLRAGTASDRGAYTSPRPIHPVFPRCISVREAARLHSYPDWFRFHVTKWHGFRQIGNSVPPLLARAIASQVVRALGVKPSKPTKIVALGEERLLRLNMTQAAAFFGVPATIVPPRRRIMTESEGMGSTGERICYAD